MKTIKAWARLDNKNNPLYPLHKTQKDAIYNLDKGGNITAKIEIKIYLK